MSHSVDVCVLKAYLNLCCSHI